MRWEGRVEQTRSSEDGIRHVNRSGIFSGPEHFKYYSLQNSLEYYQNSNSDSASLGQALE